MQNPEQSEQPNAPTDFPAYPAYKPSGVEWLGDVPAHWDVRWLKFWVDTNKRTLSEKTDPNFQFRYIEIGGVSAGELLTEPAAIRFGSAPSRARRIVRQGDTIVSTVRAYLKAVWFADDEADDLVCSTGFAVLTPKKDAFPKFVSYVVQSEPFTHQVMANSVGVAYPAISERKLRALSVPVPPLPEQRAIAAYLDRKGDIARRYAHVARHIIDTLRELRQVEIHDAVTRGLNEDIPLKPSGVEWLGDVPAHWDVRRLKYSAKTIMGQSPSGYDCDETPIGPPFLQGCAEFQERHPKPVLYCRAPKKISPAGAILLSVRAPVGRLNIADQEYVIGRGLCAIIPDNKNLDTTFAYYHLQAVTTGLRLASTGSIFDAVRLRDVRNQPIITPPLPEQRAIAEYLDAKTAAIDAAITHYERMAELVAEYWTVLVADAVTGRIDLRQTAAE